MRDLLGQIIRNQNFIKNVNTGNDSWIFEYNTETKSQSEEWQTPNSIRPLKKQKLTNPKSK